MTESGLVYQVLRPVEGEHPVKRKSGPAVVAVKYTGSMPSPQATPPYTSAGDMSEFASSHGRSQLFITEDLIQGWREGLEIMREGEVFRLTVPNGLAYGAAGAGDAIPGYQTVVFEVELLGYDEIGEGYGDVVIWRFIVAFRFNVYGPVEAWHVAGVWFLLSVLPGLRNRKGKKGRRGERDGKRL